jgi:hypothetical protein
MPLQGQVDLSKVKKILNKDLKGVYFSGLKQIVEQTPVDTGRARNSWFLSVGQPFGLSGQTNSLAQITENMPKSVIGKNLYFTNNLPYSVTLEYGGYPNPPKNPTGKTQGGFSLQAPNGWVRSTLKLMQRKIANL